LNKSADAFRTIGEVAGELDVPKHVLRFWEGKFPHIRPMKRGGGRRYYRPEDMELLRGIRHLLHAEGYTIKGVQKILREQGIDQVKIAARAAIAAAEANAPVRKRGRKAVAVPPEASAPAVAQDTPQKAAKRASPAASGPTAKDIIEAAIRELELCRQMLMTGAARTEPAAEPKRARLSRS
jgi:DNA-binding transcriptional MerR regulator